LSQVEVVECSASDLIGQYIGHTGPKVVKQLEKGLGKVLFIDEAYRLGEGHFAQEAVNELVDCVTKPRFAGKIVIILAGYDKDMNNLLRVNEGLSSRFADEFIFPALSPEHCLQLLESRLKQSQVDMPSLATTTRHDELLTLITELSQLPAWGSARDIQTLAKSMVRSVYQNNSSKTAQLIIPHDTALGCIQEMLSERRARSKTASLPTMALPSPPPPMYAPSQPPPSHNTMTSSTSNAAPSATQDEDIRPPSTTSPPADHMRDPGVSDTDWKQLQRDQKIAEVEAQATQQQLREHYKDYKLARVAENQAKADLAALQDEQTKQDHASNLTRQQEEARAREITGTDEYAQTQRDAIVAGIRKAQAEEKARSLELMRRREGARIRALKEQENRERIQRALERQREIEKERQKKEQQAQAKLRKMGVCVAGYNWIKQSHGYRCAGGSHFVSDDALGL